jgi:integrase
METRMAENYQSGLAVLPVRQRVRHYAVRHNFASLPLHEGRSVVYAARQLGHDARLTLTTYGHVIDELDELPRVPAEEAIRAARHTSCVPGVSGEAADGDAG